VELKVVCKCTCGHELSEKDIAVTIDKEEFCEMVIMAKCPKCKKEESVSLPHEVKMRLIHKE